MALVDTVVTVPWIEESRRGTQRGVIGVLDLMVMMGFHGAGSWVMANAVTGGRQKSQRWMFASFRRGVGRPILGILKNFITILSYSLVRQETISHF